MMTQNLSADPDLHPSVEPLLLRAADALESHLRLHSHDSHGASAAWCREAMNGLRAISLLSRVWIEVEIRGHLNRMEAASAGHGLRHTIALSAGKLQALIGAAELQVGGLDPEIYPEDTADEIVAELRLNSWRIVAAIAVLHAFLCLLRRREPACRISQYFAVV